MPVAEAMITGVAASLTYDLLKAGAGWLKVKAVGDAQQNALDNAFNTGFQKMLRKQRAEGLSEAEITTVGDIFAEYLREPDVASEFLDVAVAGTEPDLRALADRFVQAGGPDKLVNIRFDIDRTLITLIEAVTAAVLADARRPQSSLTNMVLVDRVVKTQESLYQTEQLLEQPPKPAATEFYSCFISHSSEDMAFVKRLYEDLTAAGVACWFAPQDMQVGERLLTQIHNAINEYDKWLVILSENSINSRWVQAEFDYAIDREFAQNTHILFPIRLNDVVFSIDHYLASTVRQRFIGDFTDGAEYQNSLHRLLRDLKQPADDG